MGTELNTQENQTGNATGNSTIQAESIDFSKLQLPEDHPLVKAYRATKAELTETKGKYNGVDPEKYKALFELEKQTLAEKEQAEQKRLETEGQYAALAEKRIKEATASLQSEIDQIKAERDTIASERDTSTTELTQLREKLSNLNRIQQLNKELNENGFNTADQDAYDLFMLRYGDRFVYDEKNGLVGKIGNKSVTPKEAIEAIKADTAKKSFWKENVTVKGSGTVPGSNPVITTTPKTEGGNRVIEIPKSVSRSGNKAEIQKYIDPSKLNRAIVSGQVREVDG